MLRAEQAKEEGAFGAKGWLVVSDERLIFSSKNELGKGEKWSVPLEKIDSAATKKPFRAATDILEILYADEKGKRKRKVFERVSLASLAMLGGAGRLQQNALAGLEHAILEAREARHRSAGQPDAATPQPAADRIEQLERLAALHEKGALTDEEFAAAKKLLIG